MSKDFQEWWGTGSNFNLNEVVKAGVKGKVTFEEGLEGGESISYVDIVGRAFSQRNSHCKNPQRRVCLESSRRSKALSVAGVE